MLSLLLIDAGAAFKMAGFELDAHKSYELAAEYCQKLSNWRGVAKSLYYSVDYLVFTEKFDKAIIILLHLILLPKIVN